MLNGYNIYRFMGLSRSSSALALMRPMVSAR